MTQDNLTGNRMNTKRVNMRIEGMSCVSCVNAIKDALEQVPGVVAADVNFATSMAYVEYDPYKVPESALFETVHQTGYHAFKADLLQKKSGPVSEEEKAFKRFAISAFLTLPLLLNMAAMFLGVRTHLPSWVEFVLATLVQFGCGWSFYQSTYHSLKLFRTNMDVLIAVGTSAAYFYSVVVFLFNANLPLYFESSATIITLILLGRWLEIRTRGKASEAIEKLIQLQPKTATIERDGDRFETLIDKIEPQDIVIVRAGESIPVDGVVIEGSSTVNESLLTGESLPTLKQPESKVFAATLNQNGFLKIRATQVGTETVLASMIRMVEAAQNSRAPIQKLADQVSEVFVPAVIVISLIAWIGWMLAGFPFYIALNPAVAVLIIACPCALGLATPAVLMVASGKGAEMGILFKEANALEEAHKLDTLIFDKTGTLTEGNPKIQKVIPVHNHTADEVLTLAAALEHHTIHPLAEAILQHAHSNNIPIEHAANFQNFPGKGVFAEKRGIPYFLGSVHFAEEKNVAYDVKIVEEMEEQGWTVSILWTEGEVIGYIALGDALRADSQRVMAALHQLKIYTIMLTGDHRKTAASLSKQAGIEEYYAEVLPAQKAERVQELRRAGKKVGMVGDGINDAPALAAANVGIALDTGSDVAIEAADITLLGGSLWGVVNAIELSRISFRKIRQNLFFAFIYNILSIPLAAFGFLNPIIAAACMALSSVCVIFNALLLNSWKGTNR